jgi:hypothetical protein
VSDELFRCDDLTVDRLQGPVNGEDGSWKRIESFLGAFAKLRKATISFVRSLSLYVRPSAWNISASAAWIFMKL